jgi:hypothetical protein
MQPPWGATDTVGRTGSSSRDTPSNEAVVRSPWPGADGEPWPKPPPPNRDSVRAAGASRTQPAYPAGRVAGDHRWPPAPSEPYMKRSPPTAQASGNAPARYDPARLRRPTTPLTGRGCPLGLGANLSVTAAEPATELTTVAAVAPATALAAAPTVLHPSLRRSADGSRPPTPEGSLLPFGWGEVTTPIRSITGRRSLPPSSPTRSPIGSSYDSLSLAGGLRAYHVAPLKRRGLGPASDRCSEVHRRSALRIPPPLSI